MDYKEEIEKAAKNYNLFSSNLSLCSAYKFGALSKAAKDYWYNEFKQTISVGILNQINDLQPHKVPEQCSDVKYLMDGSWDKYKEYIYYNPDRPISFNNWKYMVEL